MQAGQDILQAEKNRRPRVTGTLNPRGKSGSRTRRRSHPATTLNAVSVPMNFMSAKLSGGMKAVASCRKSRHRVVHRRQFWLRTMAAAIAPHRGDQVWPYMVTNVTVKIEAGEQNRAGPFAMHVGDCPTRPGGFCSAKSCHGWVPRPVRPARGHGDHQRCDQRTRHGGCGSTHLVAGGRHRVRPMYEEDRAAAGRCRRRPLDEILGGRRCTRAERDDHEHAARRASAMIALTLAAPLPLRSTARRA